MEELLDKCQHLLRPIRDLEQNWSVDLANELTQAVISLNEQMISFGQTGDKIIDFSKAALIIQGSAHVYSKKVDYLYKAVYEMKDWMEKLWEAGKKKSGRSRAGVDSEGPDGDDNEDDELDLCDIQDDDSCKIDETRYMEHADGAVLLAPKPSNLAGSFNLKIPLKSVTGDVIGYMSEFLINSLDLENLIVTQENSTVPAHKPDSVEQLPTSLPECVDMNDVHDDNDDDYNEPIDDMPANQSIAEAQDPVLGDNDTPVRVERQARQLRHRTPPPKPVPVDPWTEVLDPHSIVTHRPSKPLKPGNCRSLPPSLRKGWKRRPNGERAADKLADDIVTFCNREYSGGNSTGGSYLLFTEFKIYFADILKRRRDDLRALKRRSRFNGFEGEDDDIGNNVLLDADNDDVDKVDGCGDYNDNDDEGIPFSRLHEPDPLPSSADRDDYELPVGYSELLVQQLQKEHDDLATYSDKLTEIDKRVKDWERKVRGAIETAETRPAFDMYFYSNSIFNSFTDGQNTIQMERILEDKPKYEAFRTFVSALILANHGNIDIMTDNEQVHISLLHRTTLSDVIAGDATPHVSA